MIKVLTPVLRLDVFADWLGQSTEVERCEDIDQVLDQDLKIAGIIDESYDNEPNTIKRFEMAFEQMEWLARQDYHDIKLRTDAIVEYNYNRLISLYQEISEQTRQMVYTRLKEITC